MPVQKNPGSGKKRSVSISESTHVSKSDGLDRFVGGYTHQPPAGSGLPSQPPRKVSHMESAKNRYGK